MNFRLVFAAAFVASIPLSLGVSPADARTPDPQPPEVSAALGFHRVDRHDRVFFSRASVLAIESMRRAQAVVFSSHVPEVQAQAIRAFNTSADAYNRLVDIAATFGMTLAAPKAIYSQHAQAKLEDSATVSPTDIAFEDEHAAALMLAIRLYRNEADHGIDPAAAHFADTFATRLVHDLAVVTLSRTDLGRGSST